MLKWILPFAVLGLLILTSLALFASKPEPKRFGGRPEAAMLVETVKLAPNSYDVKITSQGIVRAVTETQLTAQVSGKVIDISDKLDVGATFNKGDVLVRLDDADYQIDLEIAKADVANAESALQQELAQAEVAKREWSLRKNRNPQAKSLFLREPQVKAAQASLSAAKARFNRAKLNLERTQIKAPFDGIVKSKATSLGQNVNANTVLSTLFATELVEIRLPIKNFQQPYLEYGAQNQSVDVYLTDTPSKKWVGYVHKVEAAIDETTRQLHALVRIKNPYSDPNHSLRVGTFVEASISARSYENVYVIPRFTLNQKNEIAIKKGKVLEKRSVNVLWKDSDNAIVNSGVNAGEDLIITPVNNLSSGTKVRTADETSQPKRDRRANAGTDRKEPPKQKLKQRENG